jgi:hypothetical protein
MHGYRKVSSVVFVAVYIWTCASKDQRVEAQPLFDVTISDPADEFGGLDAAITSNVLASADLWGQHLSGDAPIEILVQPNNAIPRATGRSLTSSFVGSNGTFNVFEQGMAFELRTGLDPNGATADVLIELSPGFASNGLWFDPSPTLRTVPVNPQRTDAVSVFAHELGHAIAFNGWIDGTTGQYSGTSQSTFDELTAFDGVNFFFVGNEARSVYGSDVPITFGSPHHLGNNSPRPGANLIPDLMNGVVFQNGTRYDVGPLDLAIAQDAGVLLDTPQPPQVTDVFIRGSGWTATYFSVLASQRLGDPAYGLRIQDGARQLDDRPWVNIDEVSLRFSEDVNVTFNDLQILGVNVPVYPLDPARFAFDANTFTATWALDTSHGPFDGDKIRLIVDGGPGGVIDSDGLSLDGEWTDGVSVAPSGDGVAGGDFSIRINVLPGDVTLDGATTVTDLTNIAGRINIGGGPSPSDLARFDVTGDASISVTDLVNVGSKVLSTLPPGQPGTSSVSFDLDARTVPEPAAAVLLCIGLVCGVVWHARRGD